MHYFIDQLSRAGTESQLVQTIHALDPEQALASLWLLDGSDEASQKLEPAVCPVCRMRIASIKSWSTVRKIITLIRFFRIQGRKIFHSYFRNSSLLAVVIGFFAGPLRVLRTRNNLGYMTSGMQRWFFQKLVNPHIDYFITNCECSRNAIAQVEDFDRGAILVYQNFVDGPAPERAPGPPRESGPPVVGVVSNLRDVKNVDGLGLALVRWREKSPAAEVRVAGDGPARGKIEALLSEAGADARIQLCGSVRDVWGFLAGVDIGVLYSYSEGLSNALLEYLRSGKATVASAVGGNVELVGHGQNGLLVPPNNHPALERALERLVRLPGLAAMVGGAARGSVTAFQGRGVSLARMGEFYSKVWQG